MFGWTVPLSTDNQTVLVFVVLLIIFLLFLKEEMGRPVHRTRNRRCVHGSWVNICKKHTSFRSNNKKNCHLPPHPTLSFQWPTTTLTNPSSALVPWPLRLTSCRRRAPTPVPTTLTKWLLSLFSISTIRVSLWGSRSESHPKNWINGIWCLIIHDNCCCLVLFLSKLVFSFCDKLFGLFIKDIEGMDPSILKGEPASGKKHKVLKKINKWICT